MFGAHCAAGHAGAAPAAVPDRARGAGLCAQCPAAAAQSCLRAPPQPRQVRAADCGRGGAVSRGGAGGGGGGAGAAAGRAHAPAAEDVTPGAWQPAALRIAERVHWRLCELAWREQDGTCSAGFVGYGVALMCMVFELSVHFCVPACADVGLLMRRKVGLWCRLTGTWVAAHVQLDSAWLARLRRASP